MFVFGVVLLFSKPVLAAENLEFEWRTISKENVISKWTNTDRVNLGFTDSTLEVKIALNHEDPQNEVLILNPTYLDLIEVTVNFGDENWTESHKFGDKNTLPNEIDQVAGSYFLKLPPNTNQILIRVSSTSSINLKPIITTNARSELFKLKSTSLQTFVIAIMLGSALIGLVTFFATQSKISLSFAAYQFVWATLLGGIQSPLPFILFENILPFNDKIVSLGAIGAVITGSLCHATIFWQLLKSKILSYTMMASASIGLGLLITYLSGLEHLALKLNVTLLSIIPILIIGFILFHKSDGLERRVKHIYLILMISVIGTGLSGIGLGSIFNVTYIHALITTVLLGYILKVELQQNLEQAFAFERDLLIAQNNEIQTQKNLSESKAFIAMLAHEIKTPLTTLRFLISGSSNETRAEQQINSIENVLNQTLRASDLPKSDNPDERILVEPLAFKLWTKLNNEQANRSQINIKLSDNFEVFTSQFVLDIILTNLLSNAIKYSHPDKTIRLFGWKTKEQSIICISNFSPTLDSNELDQIFEKYWRSPDAKRSRGTGLGLWIVKELCERNNIQIEPKLTGKKFRISLTFSNKSKES